MSWLSRQIVYVSVAIATFIFGLSSFSIWPKPSPSATPVVRYAAAPPVALISTEQNGGRRCLAHTLYYPDATSQREFGAGESSLVDRNCANLQVRLEHAVSKNDLDDVHRALALGANPNSPGEYYWLNRPLTIASKYGSFALVKLLLDNGAEVDGQRARCVGCGTPLIWASHRNDLEMVRLLLERGARTDYVELLADQTARSIAVSNGNREIVALLDQYHSRK